jgi:hypothetical protein
VLLEQIPTLDDELRATGWRSRDSVITSIRRLGQAAIRVLPMVRTDPRSAAAMREDPEFGGCGRGRP